MNRRSFVKWISLSPLAVFLPKIKAEPEIATNRGTSSDATVTVWGYTDEHGEGKRLLSDQEQLYKYHQDLFMYGTAALLTHPDGRFEHIPLKEALKT